MSATEKWVLHAVGEAVRAMRFTTAAVEAHPDVADEGPIGPARVHGFEALKDLEMGKLIKIVRKLMVTYESPKARHWERYDLASKDLQSNPSRIVALYEGERIVGFLFFSVESLDELGEDRNVFVTCRRCDGGGMYNLITDRGNSYFNSQLFCSVPNSLEDLKMFLDAVVDGVAMFGERLEEGQTLPLHIRNLPYARNDLLRACPAGTIAAAFHSKGLLSEESREFWTSDAVRVLSAKPGDELFKPEPLYKLGDEQGLEHGEDLAFPARAKSVWVIPEVTCIWEEHSKELQSPSPQLHSLMFRPNVRVTVTRSRWDEIVWLRVKRV